MKEQKILAEIKKRKRWHHDIKKIDGKWIEDVVKEYQEEENEQRKEDLLVQIIENFSIFRQAWGKAYGQYLDNDIEAGQRMHDEIIWRSASKFNIDKVKKTKGTAFNAYLVSSQMNWLKNLRNARMSHKNHPRVVCPICGEQVYQIDHQHLKHKMTIDRYQKINPDMALVNYDGEMGEDVNYYTVEKFWKDHQEAKPSFPVKCPITGSLIHGINESYTSALFNGYEEEEFITYFPDFKGLIKCPITGNKKLFINQQYIDKVFKQEDKKNFKQVDVLNPYTGEAVTEITFEMLKLAGTTVHDHVYKYAKIKLNKKYQDVIRCPFTGRKTYCVSEKDLKKINKSPWEFYMAVCEYPLRKFKVKCVCGQWVDNIWEHIEQIEHNYADSYTPDDFAKDYSSITTRAFVSTNCFYESDSGDSTHISDLVSFCFDGDKGLELEDSLMNVAQDTIDKQIATSIKTCHTMEDVYHVSTTRSELPVKDNFDMKDIRYSIRRQMGNNDFDVFPESDNGKIIVSFPSKDTIRKRLQRMIEASDLRNYDKE